MKVLITGAAGYIAQWLKPELEKHGHQVAGVDRRIRPIDPSKSEKDVWWSIGDLLDPWGPQYIDEAEPDVVVHLAAKYGRVFGEIDPGETVQVNTQLTTEIAARCRDLGVGMMYVSSSEVYGDNVEMSEDNRFLLNPKNLYGLTKKWGEEVTRLYMPQADIVRLNMPYGPGGLVGYGRNALHTMLWKAHHGMEIEVHAGTFRSYTWAGDTVAGMRMILENPGFGTWNVCSSNNWRNSAEVALMACNAAGASRDLIKIVDAPPDVTAVKDIYSRRLEEELGWKTTMPFEEGIRLTYEYVKNYDREGSWVG